MMGEVLKCNNTLTTLDMSSDEEEQRNRRKKGSDENENHS